VAGVYLHEIGHAVVAWAQGIPTVPTPAKEYILRGQVEWAQETWISLGGVAASALLVIGTVIWYLRRDRPAVGAVLAGVLVSPFAYTVRFLLVGRGHDSTEWQAAQAALGAAPAGHLVDLLFLCLLLAGAAAWIYRRRSSLRPRSVAGAFGLMAAGVVLVIALQVANNALFDPRFPATQTLNVPEGLDPR